MTVLIESDVVNATGNGVTVKTDGTVLLSIVVSGAALAGVRVFAQAQVVGCVIRGNGRTGTGSGGDGIVVGSATSSAAGSRIYDCDIDDNGNHDTLEHGIYLAKTARDYRVIGNRLKRNSASGIKVDGSGVVEHNEIEGSVRGIVLEGTTAPQAIVRRNIVSANLYAVILTSTSTPSRFDCDENTYAPGSRFMSAIPGRSGNGDLAWWQNATGLDKHSVYG